MAARIAYFGPDFCYRQVVLRSSGYTVDQCFSLVELRALLTFSTAIDLVCISEADCDLEQEAVALTRTLSTAPRVVFQGPAETEMPPQIDLVVPNLTPPEIWLKQIRRLLTRSGSTHLGRPLNPCMLLETGSAAPEETGRRESRAIEPRSVSAEKLLYTRRRTNQR